MRNAHLQLSPLIYKNGHNIRQYQVARDKCDKLVSPPTFPRKFLMSKQHLSDKTLTNNFLFKQTMRLFISMLRSKMN